MDLDEYKKLSKEKLKEVVHEFVISETDLVLEDWLYLTYKKCDVCGEWFKEEELEDTTEYINGGCGYCCQSCIEDGDMVHL